MNQDCVLSFCWCSGCKKWRCMCRWHRCRRHRILHGPSVGSSSHEPGWVQESCHIPLSVQTHNTITTCHAVKQQFTTKNKNDDSHGNDEQIELHKTDRSCVSCTMSCCQFFFTCSASLIALFKSLTNFLRTTFCAEHTTCVTSMASATMFFSRPSSLCSTLHITSFTYSIHMLHLK